MIIRGVLITVVHDITHCRYIYQLPATQTHFDSSLNQERESLSG